MTRKGSGRIGCIIPGCDRKHSSKGYCNLHYQRVLNHGDPLAGGPMRTTRRGEPQQWLLDHVEHQGQDCLIWPYSGDGKGYGQLHFDGVLTKAHRKMCELVHGPAPVPRAEAAHTCGKGSSGCVNPNHLRWATPSENQWDRVDHGTDNRGEKCGSNKLSEGEVREIDALLRCGKMTHQAIADEFGVHRCTITDIAKGKNWGWFTGRVFAANPTRPEPLMTPANDNHPITKAA